MNNLSPCLWTFHIKDTHSFSLCKSVGPTSRQLDQVPALGVSPRLTQALVAAAKQLTAARKGMFFRAATLF